MKAAHEPFRRYALLILFLFCLQLSPKAQDASHEPAVGEVVNAQGLKVTVPQPIILDPATGSGVGYLVLSSASQPPVKTMLSTGTPVNTATGLETRATFKFTNANGNGAAGTVYSDSPPTDGTLTLRVEVSGFNEAGEVVAELLNNGTPLGVKLRALNYHFPFSVKLAPESQTLRLSPDTSSQIVLVNDDDTPYLIEWRLLVSGKPLDPKAAREGFIEDRLTAKGAKPILFMPSQTLFSDLGGRLSSLFREDAQDAMLEVRPKLRQGLDNSYLPARAFPLKVRLGYWSPFSQQLAGTLVVFLILLAGGVTSLLLSYFLPNLLRRRDIKDRLQAPDSKAGGISDRIDSSLRVLVRVERRRLKEILKSVPVTSPDMIRIFTLCEQGIALLESRVDLIEDIDAVYDRLIAAQSKCPPPSLKEQVEQNLWKAAAMLAEPKPQDADFQTARTLINEAKAGTERLSLGDEEFKKGLVQRLKNLKADIGNVPPAAGKKLADLYQKLPGPFDMMDKYNDKDIPQDVLSTVDVNLSALSILRDYAQIYDGTNVKAVRDQLDAHEGELLRLLSLQSWSSLSNARLLLRQMREGIYTSDVLEAIRVNRVYMEVMPQLTLRPFEPARFSVHFQQPDIDGSAARDQFQCEWVFDEKYEERGWDITHYFAEARPYKVRAWFVDPEGQAVTAADPSGKVAVEKEMLVIADRGSGKWDRLMAESVRLMIALFIALLGLITGAQDQLSKMDFIPGMITVFLLGFSADAIKNLLTQRTQPQNSA